MRKNAIQLFTMITGVVTALVIVFSQFFYFQDANGLKKLANGHATEKHEKQDKAQKKAIISLPSFSQQTSTHADVNPKSSMYLFDIVFGERNDRGPSPEVPVSVGKFFQTLFRVFISPNAP